MSFRDLAAGVLSAAKNSLGEEAVYNPASEDSGPPDAFALRGIFSGLHLAVSLSDGAGEYSSATPRFDVQLADFPTGITPAAGDGLTLFDTEYEVTDVRPDGQGGVSLELRLA